MSCSEVSIDPDLECLLCKENKAQFFWCVMLLYIFCSEKKPLVFM